MRERFFGKTLTAEPGWGCWCSRALSASLMLLLLTSFSVLANAQLVTVQFLKGKNGKPIKRGTRVWSYFNNKSGRQILEMHTDREGIIRFDAGGAESFEVSVVGFVPCGEQPVGAPAREYSVEKVLRDGLLTTNNCGKLNSEPLSGKLLYFVRPATAWELFKN
jgi:hypothetical protein